MMSEKVELLGKGLYNDIPDQLTLKAIPTVSELDYVGSEDFEETMLNLPSGQSVVLQSGMQLMSEYGKNYYGSFKFKNSEDYLYFLKETCPNAYNEEKQRKKIENYYAWPGLAVSAVLMGVGIYYAIDANLNESESSKDKMYIWGGTGLGIFFVSAIIGASSLEHSKKAQIIFNRDCAPLPRKTHDVSLSLTVSPNSAGLTLSF